MVADWSHLIPAQVRDRRADRAGVMKAIKGNIGAIRDVYGHASFFVAGAPIKRRC